MRKDHNWLKNVNCILPALKLRQQVNKDTFNPYISTL